MAAISLSFFLCHNHWSFPVKSTLTHPLSPQSCPESQNALGWMGPLGIVCSPCPSRTGNEPEGSELDPNRSGTPPGNQGCSHNSSSCFSKEVSLSSPSDMAAELSLMLQPPAQWVFCSDLGIFHISCVYLRPLEAITHTQIFSCRHFTLLNFSSVLWCCLLQNQKSIPS